MRRTLALIGSRLVALVASMAVSSFLVFGALQLAPGSPLASLSGGRTLPPEAEARLIDRYHLGDPWLVRYGKWLGDVVRGDLGESFVFRLDVRDLVTTRLVTTMTLVAMASVLIVGLGIGAGFLGALKGGRADSAIMVGTAAGQATPSFVAAMVLVWLFAVKLGWFPAIGAGSGVVDRVHHLALPAIALAIGQTAYIARVARASVLDELDRDHVQTAVARGLPRRYVVRTHVLRNAAIPIITVSGLTVAGLAATTVVVERAFNLNGVGSLLVEAIARKDFAVVQAVALLLVFLFLVVNMLVDLTYRLLDPRVGAVKR
jgi:peptide/nickel transport system permease protein